MALLCTFFAGALAMWVIVRITTGPVSSKPSVVGSESSYSSLQKVILTQ
ncbi:MAG: hypothetical protein PHV99_01870 [Candidatus Pacebacteria bacterium]|nr:hypothetical protein [Candidatus Paceibacterota bacterium]